MYICYIDESGHCGRKYNSKQPVEVLCGVITDLTKLFKTQKEQEEWLKILNKNNIPASELKSADIYAGRGAWKNVDAEIRFQVIEKILDWMSKRSCKVFACPIDADKFFQKKKNGYEISKRLCYPYEAGAIKMLAAIQRGQRKKKRNKGKTIVVFDEQKKHDKNIFQIMEGDLSFLDDYTEYVIKPRAKTQAKRLDQIVDVPHFSKSHLSIMIQTADVVAYIVTRHVLLNSYGRPEKFKGETKQIGGWFDQIKKMMIESAHLSPPGQGVSIEYYRKLEPEDWKVLLK